MNDGSPRGAGRGKKQVSFEKGSIEKYVDRFIMVEYFQPFGIEIKEFTIYGVLKHLLSLPKFGVGIQATKMVLRYLVFWQQR